MTPPGQAALFPGMDYHVVIYSKYELVGYPLPSLWQSFSLRQKALYYLHPGHHPEGLQEQGHRQDEVQHAALLVVRVVVHTTYVVLYILYLFIGPV